MTVEDYMKLPKRRLAELLAERDKLGGIVLPLAPSTAPWFCDGTHCTNPHHDCINCSSRAIGSYTDDKATPYDVRFKPE